MGTLLQGKPHFRKLEFSEDMLSDPRDLAELRQRYPLVGGWVGRMPRSLGSGRSFLFLQGAGQGGGALVHVLAGPPPPPQERARTHLVRAVRRLSLTACVARPPPACVPPAGHLQSCGLTLAEPAAAAARRSGLHSLCTGPGALVVAAVAAT